MAGSATVTVYVTTGSCVSTDTIFVEENVISSIGVISPTTQTICSLDIPSDLISVATSTASGTITYRWETRILGSATWSPTSVSSISYQFTSPLPTGTHQFRRVTISELPGGIICE